MKGLLLKDFYMCMKYARLLALATLIFLAVAMTSEPNRFFALYAIFIASMLPYTLMAYEENCKWTTYCKTFPYTPAQIVSSKYMVALLSFGMVWLLLFIGKTLFAPSLDWSFLFLVLGAGFIAPSLMLPFLFTFGLAKGRMVCYLVIAILFGLTSCLSSYSQSLKVIYSPILFPILFVISWLLSIYFYQHSKNL